MIDLALLKTGDDVLLPENVYNPNREMGNWLARDFGIGVRYYDPLMGEAIAELFAGEGACVSVVDVQKERGAAVVERLVARGGRALLSLCDVGNGAHVERHGRDTLQKSGGVERHCVALLRARARR